MGRPAGAPNKNKRFLKAQLQTLYGKDFNPVMKMAEMAVELHNTAVSTKDPADQKTAIDGWDKVAQYVEPKLKAVEVSGDLDLRTVVRIVDLSGPDAGN